jgi:hypothetical protein
MARFFGARIFQLDSMHGPSMFGVNKSGNSRIGGAND